MGRKNSPSCRETGREKAREGVGGVKGKGEEAKSERESPSKQDLVSKIVF